MDDRRLAPRFHGWAAAAMLAWLAAAGCKARDPGGGSPHASSARHSPSFEEAMRRAKAAGIPGPGAPADPRPALEGLAAECATLCSRTADLRCGNVTACESFCFEYGALAACESALRAYVGCAKGQPLEHWECDPAMAPALKRGFCDSEQRAFSGCVADHHDRPAQSG